MLKTAISDLRTALEDDARNPRFIEYIADRYSQIARAHIFCPGDGGGWLHLS